MYHAETGRSTLDIWCAEQAEKTGLRTRFAQGLAQLVTRLEHAQGAAPRINVQHMLSLEREQGEL